MVGLTFPLQRHCAGLPDEAFYLESFVALIRSQGLKIMVDVVQNRPIAVPRTAELTTEIRLRANDAALVLAVIPD